MFGKTGVQCLFGFFFGGGTPNVTRSSNFPSAPTCSFRARRHYRSTQVLKGTNIQTNEMFLFRIQILSKITIAISILDRALGYIQSYKSPEPAGRYPIADGIPRRHSQGRVRQQNHLMGKGKKNNQLFSHICWQILQKTLDKETNKYPIKYQGNCKRFCCRTSKILQDCY